MTTKRLAIFLALLAFLGTTILVANYIGIPKQTFRSPDGKHVFRINEPVLRGGTLVRLSTWYGWPLYSEFYGFHVRDGIPHAIEWFDDVVALVDHFDGGTSLKVIDRASGDELDFLSEKAVVTREALRWKHSFSDFRNLVSERQDTSIPAAVRIYGDIPTEGSFDNISGTISRFLILFKLNPRTPVDEAVLKIKAIKTLGRRCQNGNIYETAKATRNGDAFYSLAFNCIKPHR